MPTNSQSTSWLVVLVLPELYGRPWNDIARAYLRGLRPSEVRVIEHGQGMKCDARTWRVTVFLTKDNCIGRIEQETEVDLPDGVQHGYDLKCKMVAQPLHPTDDPRLKLWRTVEQFVHKQKISCPETIWQSDRVIENGYDFIRACADIVGYFKYPDED